ILQPFQMVRFCRQMIRMMPSRRKARPLVPARWNVDTPISVVFHLHAFWFEQDSPSIPENSIRDKFPTRLSSGRLVLPAHPPKHAHPSVITQITQSLLGISKAKVIGPSQKHRIDLGQNLAQRLILRGSGGELLHFLL